MLFQLQYEARYRQSTGLFRFLTRKWVVALSRAQAPRREPEHKEKTAMKYLKDLARKGVNKGILSTSYGDYMAMGSIMIAGFGVGIASSSVILGGAAILGLWGASYLVRNGLNSGSSSPTTA